MSADLLRAAAAKAREVAEAARTYSDATTGAPLPWSASPHGDVHGRGGDWVCDSTGGNLAAHIALWHPGVALAVADLLDTAALRAAAYEEQGVEFPAYGEDKRLDHIARLLLGGSDV